jgi:uncharacterized protein (DUF2147 family)
MKTLYFFAALLFCSACLKAQDLTIGSWYNAEKTAIIKFYVESEKIFGKIIWLKEPQTNGKNKTDENNSDKTLRTRPIMGLVFLKNFKKDGASKWAGGTIYDPNNGKTYSCKITMEGDSKLNIRGYVGLSMFGRTSVFTRASWN